MSFRHLDDSALDVSAPRRFGIKLVNSLDDSAQRRFATNAFPHEMDGWMNGWAAGVPVYLAPWTACPRGGKPTAVGLTPGGQAVPGYLTPHPGYLHPRGASCPGRFILPPAHTEKILLCGVYYYLQHFSNYMQFLSYKYVNLRWLLQTFSWVSYWQGVGGKLSRAVYLAPRPEFQRELIIRKFYYTIYNRNI